MRLLETALCEACCALGIGLLPQDNALLQTRTRNCVLSVRRESGATIYESGASVRRSASIVAIPTEPIGSIPRLPSPLEAARGFRSGRISQAELLSQYDSAIQDTIARFEGSGSKVVTDGEQAKESFAIYVIHGLAADGIPIALTIPV